MTPTSWMQLRLTPEKRTTPTTSEVSRNACTTWSWYSHGHGHSGRRRADQPAARQRHGTDFQHLDADSDRAPGRAALAVRDLGAAPSTTALTSAALRAALEAVVMQAVLNEHYERHPGARPDLGDLAIAAAELDGHPLAAEPERIRQAAAEISARHPDADPEDVLLWAEARTLRTA